MTSLMANKVNKDSNVKAPDTNVSNDRPEQCFVQGAHALVVRISSYAGLAPLSFEPQAEGYLVGLSAPMGFYSYVLISALTISTLWVIAEDLVVDMVDSVRMSSGLSRGVALADILFIVFTACVGVYAAPARMRIMIQCMNTLSEVDRKLDLEQSPSTERKFMVLVWLFLMYFTAFVLFDYMYQVEQTVGMGKYYVVAYGYLGFYIDYVVVMILELQFTFTALAVNGRFRALNDALAHTARHIGVTVEKYNKSAVAKMKIVATGTVPVMVKPTHKNINLLVDSLANLTDPMRILHNNEGPIPRLAVSPLEAVKRIAALHGSLCDAVRLVDGGNGLPLLIILMSALLHLVVSPFYLVLELQKTDPRPAFIIIQFSWCINHILRMCMVVEPCYLTKIQMNRTERLLSELIGGVQNKDPLAVQLEMFWRQLFLRSVTYRPLGICTLDRPLLASIIGAVTTYLVILIQFQTNI